MTLKMTLNFSFKSLLLLQFSRGCDQIRQGFTMDGPPSHFSTPRWRSNQYVHIVRQSTNPSIMPFISFSFFGSGVHNIYKGLGGGKRSTRHSDWHYVRQSSYITPPKRGIEYFKNTPKRGVQAYESIFELFHTWPLVPFQQKLCLIFSLTKKMCCHYFG